MPYTRRATCQVLLVSCWSWHLSANPHVTNLSANSHVKHQLARMQLCSSVMNVASHADVGGGRRSHLGYVGTVV